MTYVASEQRTSEQPKGLRLLVRDLARGISITLGILGLIDGVWYLVSPRHVGCFDLTGETLVVALPLSLMAIATGHLSHFKTGYRAGYAGMTLALISLLVPPINPGGGGIASNESSAAASVRSIVTGEISYFTAYPAVGYTILANLGTGGAAGTTCPAGGPTAPGACYIDSVLANGTKSGYNFAATGLTPDANGVNQNFSVGAVPANYNSTDRRAFCANTDGVVKVNPNKGGKETLATANRYPCAAGYVPLQ